MNQLFKKAFYYFIQGILSLLPLLVCGYVLFMIFGFFEGIVDRIGVLLPENLKSLHNIKIALEFLTAAMVFTLIALFGMVVRTFVGRAVMRKVDYFFEFIPVFRS
ncbi:MAG: hypothetical protein ABIA63_05925, partial [bacterium]